MVCLQTSRWEIEPFITQGSNQSSIKIPVPHTPIPQRIIQGTRPALTCMCNSDASQGNKQTNKTLQILIAFMGRMRHLALLPLGRLRERGKWERPLFWNINDSSLETGGNVPLLHLFVIWRNGFKKRRL